MSPRGLREPGWAKALLIFAALAYVVLMLLLPLGAVLFEALRKGWDAWFAAVTDPDARTSIRLTLTFSPIAFNRPFGSPWQLRSASPPPGQSPSSTSAERPPSSR